MKRLSSVSIVSLVFGFSLLYIPLLVLMVYSFNASKLVTVWAGFSTHWYKSLFQNEALLEAAWVSLRVGLASATLATVVGTAAAFVLTRHQRFWGRPLLSGMAMAPLVMPEVILGLSMLLLFITMDWGAGFYTVIIAHITFTSAFVCVVVQSRLVSFNRSYEEAAMDLGCPPFKTFYKVTVPILMPAIISAWLLAFILSIDDVIIASFTTGPGATTLPIKIYSQIRLGITPEINALCTILIVLVGSAVLIASVLNKKMMTKKEKK